MIGPYNRDRAVLDRPSFAEQITSLGVGSSNEAACVLEWEGTADVQAEEGGSFPRSGEGIADFANRAVATGAVGD